jgi:hypothetical protein
LPTPPGAAPVYRPGLRCRRSHKSHRRFSWPPGNRVGTDDMPHRRPG